MFSIPVESPAGLQARRRRCCWSCSSSSCCRGRSCCCGRYRPSACECACSAHVYIYPMPCFLVVVGDAYRCLSEQKYTLRVLYIDIHPSYQCSTICIVRHNIIKAVVLILASRRHPNAPSLVPIKRLMPELLDLLLHLPREEVPLPWLMWLPWPLPIL